MQPKINANHLAFSLLLLLSFTAALFLISQSGAFSPSAHPAELIRNEITQNVSQLIVSNTAIGCPGAPITFSVTLRGSPADSRMVISFVENGNLTTLFDYDEISSTIFTPAIPGDYVVEAFSPGVIKGAVSFTVPECITCKQPLVLNPQNNKCECPENSHYNPVTKQCVECQSPRLWVEESLSCTCTEGRLYSNSTNTCIMCNSPRLWDATTQTCLCPTGKTYIPSIDTCVSCVPPLIVNTANGQCICPNNQVYSFANNTCVDAPPCPAPRILNPVSLSCDCPSGLNFDTNSSTCVRCDAPFEWNSFNNVCGCPGDTILKPNTTICCSVSFCSKSSECCSGFCDHNLCNDPTTKILSPFDPDSPYALLFWVLAIACAGFSVLFASGTRTALKFALFILFPVAVAFLFSPFAGFTIAFAELIVSLMLYPRSVAAHHAHSSSGGSSGSGASSGYGSHHEKHAKQKPRKNGEELELLDMPPPPESA